MLVLTWGGNRYLWLSPTIMAMVGASVALAFAFVWHARNADEPFLPLPLMGGTVVPYAMAAGGCALGAMLGLTVHLPLYYQVVYHLSASEAGLALIPLAAVSTGGAAIAGRTMARARHYKRVAIIGTIVLGATADGAGTHGVAAVGAAGAAVGVRARASARRFRSAWSRCRMRCARSQVGTMTGRDEFLPRADGVVHGGGVQRHPADGARRRTFRLRASIAAR